MNAFLSVFNPDFILHNFLVYSLSLLFEFNMHSTHFDSQLFLSFVAFRLLSIQLSVILRLLKAFLNLFSTTHPSNKENFE